MCNLSDLVEERGIKRGDELRLIRQLVKKLEKNYTIPEIANHLEESEEYITQLVTIAQKYAPEYDAEKILEELHER